MIYACQIATPRWPLHTKWSFASNAWKYRYQIIIQTSVLWLSYYSISCLAGEWFQAINSARPLNTQQNLPRNEKSRFKRMNFFVAVPKQAVYPQNVSACFTRRCGHWRYPNIFRDIGRCNKCTERFKVCSRERGAWPQGWTNRTVVYN